MDKSAENHCIILSVNAKMLMVFVSIISTMGVFKKCKQLPSDIFDALQLWACGVSFELNKMLVLQYLR